MDIFFEQFSTTSNNPLHHLLRSNTFGYPCNTNNFIPFRCSRVFSRCLGIQLLKFHPAQRMKKSIQLVHDSLCDLLHNMIRRPLIRTHYPLIICLYALSRQPKEARFNFTVKCNRWGVLRLHKCVRDGIRARDSFSRQWPCRPGISH